jgi:hypothetical protein
MTSSELYTKRIDRQKLILNLRQKQWRLSNQLSVNVTRIYYDLRETWPSEMEWAGTTIWECGAQGQMAAKRD